jgi:uncharacterized protein YjbI with pentapeptide repeats
MIIEPKLVKNLTKTKDLSNALLKEDLVISSYITDTEIYNLDKKDIEINGSHLKNIKFINCNFEKSYFVDTIFEFCDLSNLNLSSSTFKRVIFKDCKLSGANFNRSYLENVKFATCNARNIYLDECAIYSCNLNETNFSFANLTSVDFKNTEIYNCNFLECNFSKTKLHKLDFSNSEISGIIIFTEDLKGVIMNESQALDFVKILGIRIT